MLITVTNISSGPVAVNTIYKTLQVSEAVTFSRTAAQIDADLQLKGIVADALVTVTFVDEASDISLVATAPLKNYSNSTRPVAASVPAYTMIFNTDDNSPNLSDGTNWFDSDGNVT